MVYHDCLKTWMFSNEHPTLTQIVSLVELRVSTCLLDLPMRQSSLTNSDNRFPRLISAAIRTAVAGVMLACGSAVCLAENPDASQVEFDPSAEIPMEIVKGGTPATMEDAQYAGAEKATFVAITPESDGRLGAAIDEPIAGGKIDGEETVDEVVPLPARTVSRLDYQAARLVSQSRDAWLRGLMDQASYAAWLDIAVTTQLRVAKHQGDNARVLDILRGQVALWTEAAGELEAFDQPAARGWQADLAHSRVMALRAKLQYSVAAGRPLTSDDRQIYQQAAAQHLEARLQDFQTGTGTAVSLLAAARMVDEQLVSPDQSSGSAGGTQDVSVATFQVDTPVAIRVALDEIRRPVHLATYPQAISTRDLAEDRAAVRLASSFAAYVDTPSEYRDPERFLTQLDQQAAADTARQFARYETGTATAGGMLREWWLQESIGSPLADTVPDSAFASAQSQRLQGIYQVATSLQDLSGRNAADVSAAEMLLAVRQLELVPLSGRRKASAPYEDASDTSTVKVIEYGDNAETSNSIISTPSTAKVIEYRTTDETSDAPDQ